MKIEQTKYETVEAGLYSGYIVEITEDEGQYGPQLRYKIHLEKPDADLLAWSSLAFSPASKLYAWTMALFGGGAIPEDYTLDTDDLLNRSVMVNVEMREKDGGTFNRITALLPMPKEDVPVAPAATEGPPPWESEQ